MRSSVIVLLEPVVDDNLCLLGRRKPFGIEDLPTQCAVEPLVVSILPGRPRIDADRFDADGSKSVLRRFCEELSPAV